MKMADGLARIAPSVAPVEPVRLSLKDQRRIRAFIRSNTRDGAAAEDVYQDTVLSLLVACRAGRVRDVAAYAFAIARRNCARLTGGRSQAFEPLDEEEPCPAPSPEDHSIHKDRYRRYLAAMQDLSPRRREVLVRSRVRGESTTLIARSLGISTAAVDKHLFRALADLRRKMADRP